MRKPIIMVFATALIMSMTTYAHSKTLKLDPTSALAQQAVNVALPELEARGLDKEQFTAEVYKRDSSVYVIFRDRALLSEEDDDDDDSTPAEILEVTLSGDARHVVESHFAR
jgi:hypothetical protein